MTFQSAPLRNDITTGLPGEIAFDGPTRVASWILNSSGTPNVFGYAYTKVADGEATVGGTGAFLGIMIRPKERALASSGLTPSDVLADANNGDLLDMGFIFVQLSSVSAQAAAGAVGTGLFYVQATGVVSAGTAGSGETQIPNAEIYLEDVADDGLAIVRLTN